jgi:hypothetical protein
MHPRHPFSAAASGVVVATVLAALAAPAPAGAAAPAPAPVPPAIGRLGRAVVADAITRAVRPAGRAAGAHAAREGQPTRQASRANPAPGLLAALRAEGGGSRLRLGEVLSSGPSDGAFTLSEEDRRALARGLEAAPGEGFLGGSHLFGGPGLDGGSEAGGAGGAVGGGGLGGLGGFGRGPRAETRETTPAPVAKVGLTVSAGGPLQQEAVRRVLRARLADLRRCYEAGLRRRSGLAGTLALRATVTAAGVVRDVAVTADGPDDHALAECVVGVLSRAAFRPADRDTLVELSVSFSHDVR